MSEERTVYFAGPDPYVERVRERLLRRSQAGMQKYGCTLARADLDLLDWMQHLQEELLDAVVYLERVKADLALEIGDGK